MSKSHPKRLAIAALKIIVPLAVVAWLLSRIPSEQWEVLREREKNVPLLALAFGFAMTALMNNFVRWYLLVRGLDLAFHLKDAVRLGFVGYFFNFISIGSVGGDLFKAVFIAREQPGRRVEAVATVVVDRAIGLYALLLVTTAATFFLRSETMTPELTGLCRGVYIATGLGGLGIALLLLPGFTTSPFAEALTRLPKLGTVFARLIGAVRMYRARPGLLVTVLVQSLGTHVLITASVYCLANALYPQTATFIEHLVMVPLAMVAGALPFTPAGFGALELAMEKLYQIVPSTPGPPGVIVALAFRLVTIAMAAVGVVYYWTSRREIVEVVHDAEQLSGS